MSRELQAAMLQWQSSGASPAQAPRSIRTPPPSGFDSTGGETATPADTGRGKPSGPALFLDAGTPAPPADADLASSQQSVEASDGTTWTDSSTYPAALLAYAHSPPPRAVMLQKQA
ncbi:MAG: hypothetical protein U1E70_29310 [Acetobacteraceae bacterium]|nr:hypothetical protein [Pseudomonadota bacterium]